MNNDNAPYYFFKKVCLSTDNLYCTQLLEVGLLLVRRGDGLVILDQMY